MQSFPDFTKMGTNKFQEDYIEYLEDCNANLQEKLVKIREFQNRILNDRAQSRQYETTLKEVTNVCNATCEAIDNLFENFTATMNSLKIVLLWKSQISRLPEKLSYILKPGSGNANQTPASSNTTNGIPSPVNEVPDNKNGKKCGTAKVSPMIDGHVISTPRIHLNRVSEDFGLQTNRSLGTTLSPIIEASPSTSPHNDERPLFRETRISLQRLQLDNLRGKSSVTKASQNGNGVTNGEGSGFKFRKPYDSLKARYQCRLMKKKAGEENSEVRNGHDRDTEERQGGKDDAPNNAEPGENSNPQGRSSSEEADPLEGPSWLLDMPQPAGRNSSELSSFRYNFINFKRPNYSSFSRPSNDDDMRKEVLNINENARVGHLESVGNEGGPTLSVNLNRLSEANRLPNASNGSLNEESLSASRNESELDGNSRSVISGCSASKRDSSNHSPATRNSSCRNSLRSHGSVPDIPQNISPRIPRESFRLSCADPSINRSRNSSVHESPKNCSVIVNRESCESALLCENNKKKRKNESPASSCARSKSSGGQSTKSEGRRKSSGRISRPENPVRVKRRAAELCYQKLHNLEMQMREGSLPKSKKRSREKKKKSKAKH